MSMLLKTVNPHAAEAIESGPAKVGVGNMVVYHARAGYMRAGRTSFPAIVLDQQKNGDLNLLVILEREDIATEEYVPFQSHNQPHHCWSIVDHVPQEKIFHGALKWVTDQLLVISEQRKQILERLDALEAQPSRDGGAAIPADLAVRIEAMEERALGIASGPSALDISMLTQRIAALEKAKKPAAGK